MKKTLTILIIIMLSSAVSFPLYALTDKQKEARAEVFKAVKDKKIQTVDMGALMSEIDKSDEKAAAVIDKLAKMKKMVSAKSTVSFRGDGNGVFADATPPLEWSMDAGGSKKNILWQTMLPSIGPSSAIVVGQDVFTCGTNWDVICLDKKTGKIKWVKTFGPYEISTKEERAKNKKIDELAAARDAILKSVPLLGPGEMVTKNAERAKLEADLHTELLKIDNEKYDYGEQDLGFTNTTPCSDGKFIYVWNALGITACFTPEGEIKWITQNKNEKMHHGYHSSPIVVDGKVIVFMKKYIAYDAKTGEKSWESGTGGLGNELIYGSPVPVLIGGTWCFIMGDGGIKIAKSGKTIAHAAPFGGFCSPAYGSGYCVMIAPQPYATPQSIVYYYKLPSSASDYENKYTIAPFSSESKASPPSDECMHSSPVIKDGLLYFAFSRGDFYCFDLTTGKYVYTVMLGEDEVIFEAGGRPYRSGLLSSICLVNGLIYVLSNQGTMFVIEPGTKYKLLAKNPLIQRVDRAWLKNVPEGFISTPFFEGNQIFIRGERYMYCIGQQGKPFLE